MTSNNLSRRTALIGATAIAVPSSAISAQLVARSADPAFAAIEAYKAAYAFHGRCIDKASVCGCGDWSFKLTGPMINCVR